MVLRCYLDVIVVCGCFLDVVCFCIRCCCQEFKELISVALVDQAQGSTWCYLEDRGDLVSRLPVFVILYSAFFPSICA